MTVCNPEEKTAIEMIEPLRDSFPILRSSPGRWGSHVFAQWASGRDNEALEQAAAFVLSVWNGCQPKDGGWWNRAPYNVGRFDVVRAMQVWDAQHKAAFLAWCAAPFYP